MHRQYVETLLIFPLPPNFTTFSYPFPSSILQSEREYYMILILLLEIYICICVVVRYYSLVSVEWETKSYGRISRQKLIVYSSADGEGKSNYTRFEGVKIREVSGCKCTDYIYK